ncbi:disease resistance protein RUN1 isoform X3 [Lactuca sativa]|uniref:disease resistance protein RUN1 isoform X3 n=1 Tax=Lactuca sativa TaxID=4236 RepID=UPI0022AFB035|nr:disease resistance protein RUN1 isoform X3 [Lactuca sativa]
MAILTELSEEHEAEITYDVFLSFRGKDTRLGFMDHLYQALVNENISTFLDEEEVETGEELKPELARAIKSSRASIVVLSKNYASSTWCLDELVMILEQRRVSDHIVLPIFYNVEPAHIRKQESTFGEALFQHKKRIESEKDVEKKIQGAHQLKLWTKGLTEIVDLKGKDATGRRETEVIEEVVKEISTRLELHLQRRMRIPHLIGMDDSINTISSWLKRGSSEAAEILTIWGMPGIGKTTLAKHMYMLHCHEFETSSFVEAIGERCAQQTCSQLDLQKQLLGDILKKRNIEENNADWCTSKVEKALSRKKTLLVLDDVDNFEQLDVLIGTKGFHPGSKIIITTKDGSLTEKCSLFCMKFPPEHTKHALHGLSDTASTRLLCWHAFGNIDPKKGYEKEAEHVVKYCGGHPLALKILGSSLINEDAAAWSAVLEMLESKGYLIDVQEVLQISFDSLSGDCKELFKHIACFFVGKEREVTETILKECGFQASYGITELIDRCFLAIGDDNELTMHQLLQEMGRDLVRKESPDKPWKRSRVWKHEESLNLLKNDKGTQRIQGLILDMNLFREETLHRSISSVTEHNIQNDVNKSYRAAQPMQMVYEFFLIMWLFFARLLLMLSSSHCKKVELRADALRKMDKLKLLQLNNVKIEGSYKNFPKGLRWLCMRGFHSKFIPSDLPMKNLVSLDMSYSNLTQLWKKPKVLGSLKILNLSYCKLVRVEGFSGLPALERVEVLDVGECWMLKSVLCPPRTIKYLSAKFCSSLIKITFPQEMSALPDVYYRNSESLTEIKGILKIEAIAQTDEQILCRLGWTNIRHVKDHQVWIWDLFISSRPKNLPIQMLYEFGIFSTCFPGKAVPDWVPHKSSGSSISFTMPSSSMNKKIEGINISFVHTFSGTGMVSSLRTKVQNVTKNRTWIYYGYIFAVREGDEDIVWLSHWMFGDNEIENGDEVSVTIVEEEEDGGVMVRECAVNPVYKDRDNEKDPLSYYKSWKHIIGGDLSAFQLTSGDYFLNHDRFFNPPHRFEDLFEHKTTQNLLGYTPQFKVQKTCLGVKGNKGKQLETKECRLRDKSFPTRRVHEPTRRVHWNIPKDKLRLLI